MAACSTAMLTLPLLMLAATRGCSAEGWDTAELDSLTAMQTVSHALGCLGDAVGQSLRLQTNNNDVLQESLVIQRRNSECLAATGTLTDVVLQIKEQLGHQNEDIISMKEELAAFHKAEKLARENEDLKIQLAQAEIKVQDMEKQFSQSAQLVKEQAESNQLLDRTVAQLQENLLAARKENYQNILKVQALEHRLVSAKNESEKNALKVEDLGRKLNEALGRAEELEDKLKLLNNTVELQGKEKKETCSLAKGDKIRELMQEYDRSKDWDAARRGLEKILEQSSTAYRQLQAVEYSESAPLYWVGRAGSKELAEVLVTCGLAVNVADGEGRTMLYGAAYSGEMDVARYLLDHGADMETGYTGGWTVLMNAAGAGQLQLVEYLVQAGASTTAKNHAGQTALDYAAERGRTTVVQYLSRLLH